MGEKRIQRIAADIENVIDEWYAEQFTFIDDVAKAQLIARLQAEFADESLCPHGARRIDCAHCDHMEDMAYDAAREKGGRR